MNRNIETFIGCDGDYDYAQIVLFGAPFDSTTSFRPGARFGSSAIRHESFGLETYSPYQDKDLTDIKVFDCGDLELCFGSAEAALKDIGEKAGEILFDGKTPFLIIHFDAHADLRDDYLGAQLSHACVMRRCHELTGDGRIHQFCIRSGDKAEFTFAKAHTDMHKFGFEGLKELTEKLAEEHTPVYLTVDLDCLDPALFCGTGTPEAGGVSFTELLNAILTVSKTNIVGADVNELAPMLDASGASTAAACKIVREMLLALNK